ncbi:hypothetical protein SAMN05444397_10278 [Flavobacterium aquidurense]|uniref:Uncharacterized protein n=1 Tax=Flavobacterium frigidimaris TaxID=262320 RepID=A0ABX4BTB9_FLAFR|nr:hypothetical protein [Flavobacterium frigidimaris]OXA80321.1 hypothetical protein B0A65_06725 [Flavobacterium frigidimaris]SDY72522.1 hypothetical protein SAMN05444397_10278 [Flavobacterium aquidurense]
MENLITQENLEDIRELIENKIKDVPGELILVSALGSILLSSYLNKTGHGQAASIIGSLAVPIVGIGLAKYKDLLKSKIDSFEKPEPEIS